MAQYGCTSLSHQVYSPVYRKEEGLGEGIHAIWLLRIVPGSAAHRFCLDFISQNLSIWLYITAMEPEKWWFFFCFCSCFSPPHTPFFSGQPWTEIKKIQASITMEDERKFFSSQLAVSASLSSKLQMAQRGMGCNLLKSNLNEADGRSFIFCPYCWPDGQFILASGEDIFLSAYIYYGAHARSLRC